MNSAIKKYIKTCKLLFPVYGSKERKYLNNIKQHLIDISLEEKLNYDQIIERYGEPSNVIASYYEQEGYLNIINKVKLFSLIRKSIIVLLILISIFLFYRSYNLHQQYLEVKNSNNGYFEEVIE